ncbi:MAG: ATP-binding protein [Defluviitaleaceae bacterium]|nr:ATP-binding protein [Defluviitaleaceae bacterium]
MTDSNRDKVAPNRYARRATYVVAGCYFATTVSVNIFFNAHLSYWYWRVIFGLLLFFAIDTLFTLNANGRLSRQHTAWLLPTFMMGLQVAYAIISRGDVLHFWYLLAGAFMCVSYVNKRALLVYILLCVFVSGIVIYGFYIPLLGVEITPSRHFVQLAVFFIICVFLYAICMLSTERFKRHEKTSKTFATFLQMTPDFIVVINSRARVTYISSAMIEWLGLLSFRHARNQALLDLCDSFELKMMFQEIIESGENVEQNYEMKLNGTKRWLMVRSAQLSSQHISRIFEIADITPIMEAKIEAEMATKAKSDFLAKMSHEIRTPMNSIIGMLELIMLKPLDSEQLSHAISIKAASKSLLNIINDILDLSKIDSEKMEIFSEEFDVSSLINDTVNLINIKASDAGLQFTTSISKDIPALIVGDILRIKQVLINLFNNAVKFTNEGYISLGAYSEVLDNGKLKLHFIVKDTGIGIKEEDMKKMFVEFQQFDTHTNRNHTGTGLGLAISRRFIELMNGRISVESVYGKGSTFSFYVVCKGHSADIIAPLDNPAGYNVLLFEPNKYQSDAAETMFRSLGIKYTIVTDMPSFEERLGESFTHVLFDSSAESVVEQSGKDSRMFTLVKDVSTVGSASYPVNFINRPMLITNITRILKGYHSSETVDKHHDEVKLGEFKVKDVRVLVVDDHPSNLIVAEGMLRQYGIDVQTADGGQRAIDIVSSQKEPYDIIFMDHMMPDVDGIEATRAIRKMEADGVLKDINIVALSANAVTGAKEMFLDAGMDDFISKPIIIGDLHRILLKFIPAEKIM